MDDLIAPDQISVNDQFSPSQFLNSPKGQEALPQNQDPTAFQFPLVCSSSSVSTSNSDKSLSDTGKSEQFPGADNNGHDSAQRIEAEGGIFESQGRQFPAIGVIKVEPGDSDDSDREEDVQLLDDESGTDSDADAAFNAIVLAATAKAQIFVKKEIKQEPGVSSESGEIAFSDAVETTLTGNESDEESIDGSYTEEVNQDDSAMSDFEDDELDYNDGDDLPPVLTKEEPLDEFQGNSNVCGTGINTNNESPIKSVIDTLVDGEAAKRGNKRKRKRNGAVQSKSSESERTLRSKRSSTFRSEIPEKSEEKVSLRLRSFECGFCYQKYTSQNALEKHIALVHDSMMYADFDDEALTENLWEDIGKMEEENQDVDSFAEEEASTSAQGESSNTDLICERCGKLCTTQGGLSQHKLKHLSKEERDALRIHKCSLCTERFVMFATLFKHQKAKHGATPCLEEKKAQKKRRELKLKKYGCTECQEKLTSTNDLDNHYKTVHNLDMEGKVFVCRFCDKRFRQPNLLEQHENVHLNRQPYVCDICDRRKFNSREAFRRHKLDCQARLEGIEHKCPYCEASYTARNSMLAHVRSIHGNKTRCKKCSRVLSSERALNKHLEGCKGRSKIMNPKTGSVDYLKPYWNQMELLQYRIAGGTARKTIYRCVRCKAEGNSRQEVANHIVAVHQPELLRCELCGKDLPTLAKVSSHKRTCVKRMCPHCGEIFCSIQYARFHTANAKCLEKPDRSESWKIRKLVKRHKDSHKEPGSDEDVTFIDA